MSLPCGPAPEANLSAQKNHVLMEDSMALSDDAGKVQLVPGSSSSPPELDKTSGIQIVENPSDSVYRKTCHQVLFFSFFFFFLLYILFFFCLVSGKMWEYRLNQSLIVNYFICFKSTIV